MTACKHMNFKADVCVARLSDREGGPIIGYTADIRVKCADCGLPFRFSGVLPGSHPVEPRVSVDATELRAPIEPAYVPEILNQPAMSGRA